MSRPVRIVLLVLLVVAVVVLLFTTVFPWVERTFEQDPTVLGPPTAWVNVGTAG